MTLGDTSPPDYLARFKAGAWQELTESAVVEWNPEQAVNLHGAGFGGTKIEYLDGEPDEEVRSFIACGVGDLVSLARRLGGRTPTAEDLGRDYVLSRQRAGAGFRDRGYGPEGDRLHELARSFGDIALDVGGSEGDPATWVASVTT